MLTWHRTTALQNDGEKTISAFEIRPPFCRRSHLTSSNKGEAQNPSCSEKYPPCLSFSSLCPRHFSITICQGLPRLVPHSPYSRLIIHPPKPQLSHTQNSNPQWLCWFIIEPSPFPKPLCLPKLSPCCLDLNIDPQKIFKLNQFMSLWATYLLSSSNRNSSLHRGFFQPFFNHRLFHHLNPSYHRLRR